jgi:DNA-binding response OmpR family regulator
MRILVVEDEASLANFVSRALTAEGHTVRIAHDGPTGERIALADEAALVVLDVMLPGKSGLDVLRSIRAKKPAMPVILLTARGSIENKVEGLDLGADDYITKPFSFDELLARVRAQLRDPGQATASSLTVGDLTLDLRSRRVTRAAREVELSTREFDLLAYLMRHPDQVLSRSQILDSVWGLEFDPDTKVVEVYVSSVRRKLAGGDGPAPIETVRNVGYRLRS